MQIFLLGIESTDDLFTNGSAIMYEVVMACNGRLKKD